MAQTTRLDVAMVARGMVVSREQAKRLIMSGEVVVDGLKIAKADYKVKPETPISLKAPEKYVSRGGIKLEAALVQFALDVSGQVCLDVGASTGGFTDCLLQHGARKVYAVDVGHGQLAWRLRQDPRVELRERVNARYLDQQIFQPVADFASVDVSFISLKKILPAVMNQLRPGANCVVLIKPQFEAGKDIMNRCQGVLKDRALQEKIADDMAQFARQTGYAVTGLMDSPVSGTDGNREFLMALKAT